MTKNTQEIVLSKDKKELAKSLREKHKTLNWEEVDEIINQKDDKEIRYEWFTWNIEALKKAWLEPFNFNVDSTWWQYLYDQEGLVKFNWNSVKISPNRDIFEVFMKDWTKEQVFSYSAAIKETELKWYKIPSRDDWELICSAFLWNKDLLVKNLWLVYDNDGTWKYMCSNYDDALYISDEIKFISRWLHFIFVRCKSKK